ncbi:19828_t:CDS:1 [Cetraspora pellucida]|uniref:19828_t:CDS:1 n=1 Tax=Cetraspora pellucida TaxID=1433469 RepID=A0A9N9EZ90_9GLOM|nr:19828_t:CDS:1 [Cetraspora pellucida]
MPKVLSRPKKCHQSSNHNINILELVTSINVPFPPKITIKDLLAKVTPHDNKPGRTPNAFISYKMVLHRALKSQGFKYPIWVISKIASLKWKHYEPNHVKSHYIKLADEAKQDYKKSGPFFIMAPDCKGEKETNPQKESFDVESDNYNASIHLNNEEQGSYNCLTFGQQTMDFFNGFSVPSFLNESCLNESFAPLNESSTLLYESSASLNEYPKSLYESSVPLNDHLTHLNESPAPLTTISNVPIPNYIYICYPQYIIVNDTRYQS